MKTGTFQPEKSIYSKPSDGSFFSPFGFSIDSMEQLILVNFEKDPDELYHTFEMQRACDESGRKSFLVIAYRTDGAVDIYHQPAFSFGSQTSILNDVTLFERPMEDATFEVDAHRLEVYFSFADKTGRPVTVRVTESNRAKKKPFFLLAPVGVVSRQPAVLPVYSLYGMSFTKQKFTKIEITIGGVMHKPDPFALPVDCSKNYFTRYSADVFNVDWNPNFNGPLVPLFPGQNNTVEQNGTTFEIVHCDGHPEIKSMSARNRKHQVQVRFSPPFPDVACLNPDTDLSGEFVIQPDSPAGVISGTYYLRSTGDEVILQFSPAGGWQPGERRWILKFLFFVVKIFKEWPKSYVWNARIQFNGGGNPVMQSGWARME